MGYFRYFIKCIIRNIAYRLCKPKVLLTIFAFVTIFFALHSTGYCADWTDGEIEACLDGLATITVNQGTIIAQLSSMGVNVSDIENSLDSINTELDNIGAYTSNINDNIVTITSKINNITTLINSTNNKLLAIYNTLNDNQKELINKLDENNQILLNELQMIRDSINGIDEELTNFTDLGVITSDDSNYTIRGISLNYEPGYSYKIKLYCRAENYSKVVRYYYSDNLISNGFWYDDLSPKLKILDTIPSNVGTYIINYNVPTSNPLYIYFAWGVNFEKIEVYRSIKGISDNLSENNTLQQEQNQLQQEQNNFLKDDNVDTEGFEFATNDTNNPTEDGFNTLFMSVYNAFCNTSSAPLTVTLPYINETFTIQPNLVSNAMQKCGLGVVATLIQSFYYYCVCLFIYKDINKIIEHLKSGNLTADCGNVKTEVL